MSSMSTVSLLTEKPAGQSTRLLKSLGTMGAAEIFNRLTRLATAVALARVLGPVEFGIAAIALTSSEFFRVLTQTGIGARIISSTNHELEATCVAAHRLNWILYLGVFCLQVVLAWPIAQAYGNTSIAYLMMVLAVPFLLYPLSSVQVFRVQRRQDMNTTALMSIVLISGDNLMTCLLALLGFGLWSVAFPKIIVAIAWVVLYRRYEAWRPYGKVEKRVMIETLRFGRTVLLTELLATLRLQGDKLLIGQMLGLALLGTYFFAFNAGLGITTALITACGTALFPYFAKLPNGPSLKLGFAKAVAMLYGIMLPIFALQIGLAPFYVPIVFGHKWIPAIYILMILCMSGIPFVLWRATSLLLRAKQQAGFEFKFTILLTVFSLFGLLVSARFGLEAIAWSQLIVLAISTPIFTIFTLKHLSKE